jgi:hypothetical protein
MPLTPSRRPLLGVIVFLLILSISPIGRTTDQTNKAVLRRQLESPGDPPGVPAREEYGALPAPPVQFQTFTSIQVNVGGGGANVFGDAANEPSIAVDPIRPNRMAIGWRQFNTIESNFRQAGWAYSSNGGRTWTFPGVIEPGVFRSDPVLGFDADGRFYFASLKVSGSAYSVQVFKSWDGGATWGQAIDAFGGDKEWFTVDRTGGTGRGHLYHAWSVAAGCCADSVFNRSIDGGTRFSVPRRITPATPVWGTLAVGPDGSLYVAGTDIDNQSKFYVAKSTNAKNPVATPTFDFVTQVNLGGVNTPFLGGASPNPDGLLGQVWVAVDRSGGPRNGYVYVLCSVDPPGDDPQDVNFIRSTNGGLTWSAPVRVNSDPLLSTSWQWFGTMSVSGNGRIDVVWNDSRNTRSFRRHQLFYSSSADGGLTWSPNQAVSPVWDSQTGWPNQFKIGDYYDMVSDLVGAHVAWAATFNNEQDVYYLRIGDYDCNSNGVGDALDISNGTSLDGNGNGIPDECEDYATSVAEENPPAFRLHQNMPNPFNPSTMIRYDVPTAGRVRIRVFDVAGRLVRTLIDRVEPQGAGFAVWDGGDDEGRSVTSGVYFCRMDAPGFSDTRKMVLLR